jgi:hypothetical protein
MAFVMVIEQRYPLQEYQNAINKNIDRALERQYTEKHMQQLPKLPKQKKDFLNLSLKTRLSWLNRRGALNVAESLSFQLQKIKTMEKRKAKGDATKAMAQGRIVLRGVSAETCQLLVEWAYHAHLRYEYAEQIYALFNLAINLGVDALAEECVELLYETAHKGVEHALSTDIPLRYLLNFVSPNGDVPQKPQPQPNDVVAVVFHHVLKDAKPPARLSQLVIDTLAKSMDAELWDKLQETISHETARQLIGAMVVHRDLKSERGSNLTALVKVESHLATEEAMSATAETNVGSALES